MERATQGQAMTSGAHVTWRRRPGDSTHLYVHGDDDELDEQEAKRVETLLSFVKAPSIWVIFHIFQSTISCYATVSSAHTSVLTVTQTRTHSDENLSRRDICTSRCVCGRCASTWSRAFRARRLSPHHRVCEEPSPLRLESLRGMLHISSKQGSGKSSYSYS